MFGFGTGWDDEKFGKAWYGFEVMGRFVKTKRENLRWRCSEGGEESSAEPSPRSPLPLAPEECAAGPLPEESAAGALHDREPA